MKPDRNKSGMQVNTLMQIGLITSAAIPVVFIVILGVFAFQGLTNSNNPTTYVLVVTFCALVVLFVELCVNYSVQRKIKDRFLELISVCRDYSGGDRSVRVVVNGDDEFAKLALALNTLFESQAVMQSGAPFGMIGSDAATLQAQIEKLLQEVSAVGDGDLRVQAEVTPDTLGVLADSFNYMIEELTKVVGRVQTTAVQVTNATRRILDRSAELAQASETQVSQISQTTEAVEALAIFIKNVAHNAQLSADVAQEALHNASSGQQSVRQTIDGMLLIRENVQETSKKIKRLGERSNEIGEIVRIIEDIADQTNLLALNAAIQSAMAGEHGRGFAVVADEIRLLAERSTESTKRIDTLVKSIQGDTYEAVVAMEDSTQEVVKGSQLADEAGRSLNSIYSAVERQAQMIESIARAANEQTSVSEAVAVAMGQISDITRQTNVGMQEAAASVSYLAELSDQLRSSVSTFRLPDRSHEMMGAYPNMTSFSQLPGGNGNQLYSQALGTGGDSDWGQNYSGNFPPLPEPSNSGLLVALPTRSGQIPYNSQQQFGNQPSFNVPPQSGYQQQYGGSQSGFSGPPQYGSQAGFSGQQQFGNQPGFGGQQQYGSQHSFAEPQQYGGQPGFGGQQYGGQQSFDEYASFENQQNFGEQQYYGSQPSFRNESQVSFPASMQTQNSQPLNSGPLRQPQQPGPSQASRQLWQRESQQRPSQTDQDQTSLPKNGQYGQ